MYEEQRIKIINEYTKVLTDFLYDDIAPLEVVDKIKEKYLAKLFFNMPPEKNNYSEKIFNKIIFEARTINIEMKSDNERWYRKHPSPPKTPTIPEFRVK